MDAAFSFVQLPHHVCLRCHNLDFVGININIMIVMFALLQPMVRMSISSSIEVQNALLVGRRASGRLVSGHFKDDPRRIDNLFFLILNVTPCCYQVNHMNIKIHIKNIATITIKIILINVMIILSIFLFYSSYINMAI